MPAVLSRDALADLLEAASFHEEAREEDLATIEAYARRIRTVFDAAGTRPPASRLGHGVDADDATRPATIERYVDALALGGTGGGDDGLPFYPPVDLSRVISRAPNVAAAHEAPLPLLVVALARGQDVPDLLGRAAARETASGCLGRSAEKDLGLCAHFNDVCLECTRDTARTQLGDAARVTGAGLACMMSSCTVPLQARRARCPVERQEVRGRGPRRRRNGSAPRAERLREGAALHPRGEDDGGEGRGLLVPEPGVRRGHRPPERDAHLQGVRCEVCKSCYQKKHAGPCAVAADSSSVKLCRDNFQKCPRCKAVVEKKMACDHMRCCCGQTFCSDLRLRRARHGCPMECKRPRASFLRSSAPGQRRARASC